MTARNPDVPKDSKVLTAALVGRIRERFELEWRGIHGANHWARVRRNGLELVAETPGAELEVVELFAFLHDSRRRNDGADPRHGDRAAAFVGELYEAGALDHCGLAPGAIERLMDACRGHSGGGLDGHPTVLACWDADRLDLGRVGIRPNPRYLCTPAARVPERIERCWRSSRMRPRYRSNRR